MLKPIYNAELKMVKGRETLLFGIKGSEDPLNDPKRFVVQLAGTTQGTIPVPVHFEFYLDGNLFHKNTNQFFPKLDAPEGGCVVFSSFEAPLPAREGIPPDKPFQINGSDYVLTAKLIRDDNGADTGFQMSVIGKAVERRGPITHFIPIIVAPLAANRQLGLQPRTDALAQESAEFIPDYYPIPQRRNSLPTVSQPLQDYSYLLGQVEDDWTVWAAQLLGDPGNEVRERLREVLVAVLNYDLATSARLVGAERLVVILEPDVQYGLVASGSGFTASTKIVFLPWNANHWDVAHELVHTLPKFIWSASQMSAKCEINYHNTSDNLIAHGYQITYQGAEDRESKPQVLPMMGSPGSNLTPPPNWITQCTYWHLLEDGLPNLKDPAVVIVRGRLMRSGTEAIGELRPSYGLDGIPDLTEGNSGDWAFILRNSAGDALGRYPFDPGWELHDPPEGRLSGEPSERNFVGFSYQVPELDGIARIDLVGPNGLLDQLEYSANAPTVSITEPSTGSTSETSAVAVAGKVQLAWDRQDADGNNLLYSTFYSGDGGETWLIGTFETSATQAGVAIDLEASLHMLKVVATDGVRSAESIVEFSISQVLAEAPTPTFTPTPRPAKPTPMATATPAPTATLAPTPTATPVPTPTPTRVPDPTATQAVVLTIAPSHTPSPEPTQPATETPMAETGPTVAVPEITPVATNTIPALISTEAAPTAIAAEIPTVVPTLAPVETGTPPTTTPASPGLGGCSAPIGEGAKLELSWLALLLGAVGLVAVRWRLWRR